MIYWLYGNINTLTMSFHGDNVFLMFKYYNFIFKYKKKCLGLVTIMPLKHLNIKMIHA